jgi:4-amino-4-deoxy-L-arabinose transferase-like glycosyltransferase
MLGIFGAWAIPFMHMVQSDKVMSKWSNQFVGRVTGEFFSFSVWITTIPRALAYFLPWLLVTPFIRFSRLPEENDRKLARALVWSAALPLVIISLIPGGAPRYSLPVLIPFCWLMAMVFGQDAFAPPAWLGWLKRPWWPRLGAAFVALGLVVGLIVYPIMALASKQRQKVKNISDKINAVVPETETLYAVDPNYQPFFFYMRCPVNYVSSLEELPYDTHYFLVRPGNEKAARESEEWAPRHPRSILRATDYRKQTIIVFVVDPT